jgi:hypothetical protein
MRLSADEGDWDVLTAFLDMHCRSSVEGIKTAVDCNYRDKYIVALTQSVDLADFFQSQIDGCDRKP